MLPFFGKYKLQNINEILVDKWVNELKTKNNRSNSTVNKILKGLKLILSEAYRRGAITTDVSKKILMLKNDSRTHGVFTKEEIEKLFDEKSIMTTWNGSRLHYTLNLLTSKTGMRVGEVQGLQKEDVFSDHILVEHSWNERYGLQDTKTHKSRIVPISGKMYELIQETGKKQVKGDFIFSADGGISPIRRVNIAGRFKRSLRDIGISLEEQKKRYLTFHSYRHYVNSLLINSGVPKSIVQSIIGHINDEAMTEHYTHVQLEEQKQVLSIL